MKRREFITTAGAGSLALGAAGLLSACGVEKECKQSPQGEQVKKVHEWKMVTTWPKNFPGLGTGANRLAEVIGEMSGNRIQVKVYGATELVPPFEVFDTVSRGTAEMGHGSAYYWKGKSEAAQFFSTVPFGLTAQEMNGWMYYGDGLKLWSELYQQFGLIPAPAGNTGVQMGGWFNKEINSVQDLQGLKMRIPGLGGEVLRRAGGTPVNLPGGELFTSLQSGAIDATEWVNPYNDLAFGLYKVTKYYYYPGFHEPGTVLEAIINQQAFDRLEPDLQAIVLNACKVVNLEMLSEYAARNPTALRTLKEKHNVDIRRYPDDVLETLRKYSAEVVQELANKDEFTKRVYASYREFLQGCREWSDISTTSYLNARDKA